MPWFRVDDQYGDHPKIKTIPWKYRLQAVGLWTLCGNWAARNLTDGFIPDTVIEENHGTQQLVDYLVNARVRPDEPGLWIVADGGYQFHDWHLYQPTRASVEAEREATRKRVTRWREQRRNREDEDDGAGG
jgi:hypothetical protein